MPKFAKAFVSHSSSDKPLLNEVVQQVAAARWEIDAYTFDQGQTSADEILNSVSRSDLFVLFASAKSLASPWVASELQIAQSNLYSGKLGAVLVFIIDGTGIADLPQWLRLYVVARTSNPTRIANSIRSKLVQLDSLRTNPPRPFVSRSHLRDQIEQRLADVDRTTSAIYVCGIDGIGRRALIANSLGTLFPGSDVVGIDILLVDGEGLVEIYRKLHLAWRRPTLEEANELFRQSATASDDDLVKRIIELLDEIAAANSFLWLQCDFGTLNEEGCFEAQFDKLFVALSARRPTLIVRARRFPRFSEQAKLNRVAFFKVESLSDEGSRRLWSYALAYHNFPNPEPRLIAFLQGHISGHPGMIWTAAEYVSRLGRVSIEANPKELLDTLRAISLALIDGLQLTQMAERLLALFDEFRVLSSRDLVAICGIPDQELAEAVGTLISFGLVESDEDHLKLASVFYHSRFRKRFSADAENFLRDARMRLLNLTQTYESDDNVSFATIDAAILTAIKEERELPLSLDERAVVGSHYLRVARSRYDKQRYGDALKFCQAALAKVETLSESAVVECLRLQGMSAVREGDNDALESSLDRLANVGTKQARRHVHFVEGFAARWDGEFETAERAFRDALALNPKDVHVLRELAQILVVREDFEAAVKFARGALEQAKSSHYVIDILLQCLIAQHKGDPGIVRGDTEIADLLARLEVADKRENTSFYPVRQAQYHSALNNRKEALQWLDKAIGGDRSRIFAYGERAQIRLSMKNDAQALAGAEADIREIERLAGDRAGSRRYLGLTVKLRIRLELARGDIRSAVRRYDAAAHRLGQLRGKLALEIADRIMLDGLKDRDLVVWANSVLAHR